MTTTPGYDAWAQRSAAADKPQPNPFKGYKKPKGHSWHKIYRREAYNASVQPDLGLDLRLWFLVVNRAGYNGHAQFPGDSLLEALPKYNRSTGEVSRYSIRALQKVIAEGVRANLYAPTSGPRCIILGAHLSTSIALPATGKRAASTTIVSAGTGTSGETSMAPDTSAPSSTERSSTRARSEGIVRPHRSDLRVCDVPLII